MPTAHSCAGQGPRRCAAKTDRRSGSAAIEFGLCVPLFALLLMAVVELGFAMFQSMQVYNSVEAGTHYAAKNDWDAGGVAAAVVNATGTPGIAASPPPVQFCGCPTAGGVAEAACNSNCPNGDPPGQYARISASLAHQTILPYPGLPLPATLTAQSVVRLK